MKTPSAGSLLALAGVVLAVLVLTQLTQPGSKSAADQLTSPVKTLDPEYQTYPWSPFSLTGNGARDTESFYVGAREWRLCGTIRDADLTRPSPLYLRVYNEEGRSIANTSFEGRNGDSACSVVRSEPGRFYIGVNAGIGWMVEAKP